MRERCLQSLAILLAGLFSAEKKARERPFSEVGSGNNASPEPEPSSTRDARLRN